MKKFVVIIAVLALTMAMASVATAQVTVNGSIEFLMRSVKNLTDWNDDTTSAGDTFRQTYERVRIGIDAKHDKVKGRIQIENDWDTWGRFETAQGNGSVSTTTVVTTGTTTHGGTHGATTTTTSDTGRIKVREAWIDFNLPFGLPGYIKVGHQFLQLGNGWYFRSNKYGSDAWVLGFPGKNTVAFVNVKAAENDVHQADDTDAYVLLDTYKIDDKSAVGAYIARIRDRKGDWANRSGFGPGVTEVTHDTLGVHYNGVIGPIKLGAQLDYQMGEIKYGATTEDLSGWQAVLQASMPAGPLTVNATVASGTGDDPDSATENEQFMAFQDKDPHYTLVYEYFMNTAAGAKNTSFANTLALNLGASFKVSDVITLAADLWMLKANEKVNLRPAATAGPADTDLGNEVDVKVNLKLADQLTWNTTVGYFMPGKAYENNAGKADDVQAIQSVLSYRF